ncbi:hypothetical protein JCM3774_000759 [Rhodotorula dairenensis]
MAPAATKRALSLSQSSQSPSQTSTARPRKRPRTVAPVPQPATASTNAAAPVQQTAPIAPASNGGRAAPDASPPVPAKAAVSVPPPKKRTLHQGKLRRLSTGHPQAGRPTTDTSIAASGVLRPVPRVREKSTLAGAKVGGKSKDLRDRVEAEQLWIRRPAKNGSNATARQGLGYAGYLKMGVAAFVERGCTTLTLHALGAAIPLCLSLALAIRDAIPGGEPSSGGEEERDEPSDAAVDAPVVRMEVLTGSKDVHDEITPDDEDEDIVYQTRTKSTVSVMLSLAEPLRSSLGAAPPRNEEAMERPSRPSEHYEDVALGTDERQSGGGRGGDVGDVYIAVEADERDQSASEPPSDDTGDAATSKPTTAAAATGAHPATSYYPPTRSVEAAYPPLPSFSRPSDSRLPTTSAFLPDTDGPPSSSATRHPPVRATFARLRALLDAQSPALLDSLSPPLPPTDPALASLKAAIAPYRLPQPVIDSYLLAHDGQDVLTLGAAASGGASGGASLGGLGLVYGLWWLPLDRVEEEWRFWRRLEEAGGLVGAGVGGDPFSANATEAANRSRHASRTHPYVPEEQQHRASTSTSHEDGKGTSMQGMASFPDGWVRNRYSHPGWLPLLTDRCGNYIGIDLDPPPPPPATRSEGSAASAGAARQRGYGQPGQVIAFGREIDEKVVLFPGDGPSGWARFLAAFVDDLEKGEFARLGERPNADARGQQGNGWRGEGAPWSDEEHSAARRTGSDGSEEGYDGLGDGLGERGYFETNLYGDEAVGTSARTAQTWVLRSEYRRLSDELSLEGGVIALLCERSRRKWQSLGVGSNHPAHRRTISIPIMRDGILMPSPRKKAAEAAAAAAPATVAAGKQKAVAEEEEEMSGAVVADPAVSVVLSPPSPKKPSAFSSRRQPDAPEPSSAHDSHPSLPRSDSGAGGLRSPARSSFKPRDARQAGRSDAAAGSRSGVNRRPPPPPPAPLDLPVFAELDFSDALGNQQPRPIVPPSTASWLLADPPASAAANRRKGSGSSASGAGGGGALAEATNMLSRISFSSSSTSPLASPTLLPLAQNPMSSSQAGGSPSLDVSSPSSEAPRSPTLSESHVVVVEHH